MIILNNFQINELFIGAIVFCFLLCIYNIFMNELKIMDILIMVIFFGLTYFLANLSYNFLLFYL